MVLLSMVLLGMPREQHWEFSVSNADFFHKIRINSIYVLKIVIYNIINALGDDNERKRIL